MFGVDPRPLSGVELNLVVVQTCNSVPEWVELENMEVLLNDEVNESLTQARAKKDTDWPYLVLSRKGPKCETQIPECDGKSSSAE